MGVQSIILRVDSKIPKAFMTETLEPVCERNKKRRRDEIDGEKGEEKEGEERGRNGER